MCDILTLEEYTDIEKIISCLTDRHEQEISNNKNIWLETVKIVRPNHKAIGHRLRGIRRNLRIRLKTMAAMMHCSVSCLSAIELGNRAWSVQLVSDYIDALESIGKQYQTHNHKNSN